MAEARNIQNMLTPDLNKTTTIMKMPEIPESFTPEELNNMEEYLKFVRNSGIENPATAAFAEVAKGGAEDHEKNQQSQIATHLVLSLIYSSSNSLEELLAALEKNPMVAQSPMAMALIQALLNDLDTAADFLNKAKAQLPPPAEKEKEPEPEPTKSSPKEESGAEAAPLLDRVSELLNEADSPMARIILHMNSGSDLNQAILLTRQGLPEDSGDAHQLLDNIQANYSATETMLNNHLKAIQTQRHDGLIEITNQESAFNAPTPQPEGTSRSEEEDEPPTYDEATKNDGDLPSYDDISGGGSGGSTPSQGN